MASGRRRPSWTTRCTNWGALTSRGAHGLTTPFPGPTASACSFSKRLSDRFEEKAEALMAEGVSKRWHGRTRDEHQVFVPDQARWGTIQKQTTHIGERLNAASAALEEQNRAFEGILTSIDYTDESKWGYTRESVLADMIRCCSEVSLRNDRMADPDLLSAAHEDLLEWSPTTRPARRPGSSTRRGGRL